MDNDIRLQWRLVLRLNPWNMRGLSAERLPVNPLRITLHGYLQWRVHINLEKLEDLSSCPISIGALVRCGVENHGEAVIGEHFPDECNRSIEIVSILIVVVCFC